MHVNWEAGDETADLFAYRQLWSQMFCYWILLCLKNFHYLFQQH